MPEKCQHKNETVYRNHTFHVFLENLRKAVRLRFLNMKSCSKKAEILLPCFKRLIFNEEIYLSLETNDIDSFFQVRYLKIIEKSGYQALPWVRYITQNGDYQLRTN